MRTEVDTNVVTQANIRPTPASSTEVRNTQEVSLKDHISLGSDIYGIVETVLETGTLFSTDSAGDVTPFKKVNTQVLTSLFSASDVPKYRYKRDVSEEGAASRDERQFQTKLFGDVEVVVKGNESRKAATVQPNFTSAMALL